MVEGGGEARKRGRNGGLLIVVEKVFMFSVLMIANSIKQPEEAEGATNEARVSR